MWLSACSVVVVFNLTRRISSPSLVSHEILRVASQLHGETSVPASLRSELRLPPIRKLVGESSPLSIG
jgi:hypothetical protein